MIQLLVGLPLAGRGLGQDRAHGLEEADVVADAQRFLMGHREREGLGQRRDGAQQPVLAVLLREDVLLRRRQEGEAVLGPTYGPERPIEPMEQPQADLVSAKHLGYRFGLVDRRLAGAAALRVGRERLPQLVGKTEIVHYQPAGLVLEDAVHPSDGLHEAVAAHRLVHVHRGQARRVETGQPHVADDDKLEWIGRIAESQGESRRR